MAPRKAGRRRDTCVEEQKLVAAKKSWLCCLDLMINQGGSLHMKYKNANTILPEELVKELQKYIQAGYIYVPAKDEQRRAWGELSGYREELRRRNQKIASEYSQGISVEKLASRYCLSMSAIRKIIYQK